MVVFIQDSAGSGAMHANANANANAMQASTCSCLSVCFSLLCVCHSGAQELQITPLGAGGALKPLNTGPAAGGTVQNYRCCEPGPWSDRTINHMFV